MVSKYGGNAENDFLSVIPVQNPPHSEQRVAGSLPCCWPYTPTFDIARQPSSIWARQGSAYKKRSATSSNCSLLSKKHEFPELLRNFVALDLIRELIFQRVLAWKGVRVVGWPGGASQAGGSVVEARRPPSASPGTSYRPALLAATLHCLLLLPRPSVP